MLEAKLLTRDEVERHSLDMRQFIDFRQATLPNGMRIIEAYNSSGLTFTLLPDRGMDIWMAHYKGVPLTWISQGSPFCRTQRNRGCNSLMAVYSPLVG